MKDLSKVLMWSYDPNSESGKLLADSLGIKRIRHENSTFFGGPNHTVVNWGASPKRWGVKGVPGKILNHPSNVKLCTNKRRYFETCEEAGWSAPRIPDWTENPSTAEQWVHEGHCVLARTLVEGKGGEGIEIVEKLGNHECIVSAPLYTKFVPNYAEFRIYVVGDKMVDFCQKKRKLSETPKNWKVRSRENGFVYCWVDPHELPTSAVPTAIKAVKVAGLQFGGVDVVCGHDGFSYVLEVNTAPWLSDSTADAMAEAIKETYL